MGSGSGSQVWDIGTAVSPQTCPPSGRAQKVQQGWKDNRVREAPRGQVAVGGVDREARGVGRWTEAPPEARGRDLFVTRLSREAPAR